MLQMQACVSIARSLHTVIKLYSLQAVFMFALLMSDFEGINEFQYFRKISLSVFSE